MVVGAVTHWLPDQTHIKNLVHVLTVKRLLQNAVVVVGPAVVTGASVVVAVDVVVVGATQTQSLHGRRYTKVGCTVFASSWHCVLLQLLPGSHWQSPLALTSPLGQALGAAQPHVLHEASNVSVSVPLLVRRTQDSEPTQTVLAAQAHVVPTRIEAPLGHVGAGVAEKVISKATGT